VAWLTRARFLLDRMIGLLPGHERRPSPVNLIPYAIHVGGRADLPRLLNPRCLYLVGDPPKWAIFRCPCGTGHQIDLNLAHADRPRWNVAFNLQNRPSLRPSVDVQDERRCHFWLTSGEVCWCQDSGRRLPTLTPSQRRSRLREQGADPGAAEVGLAGQGHIDDAVLGVSTNVMLWLKVEPVSLDTVGRAGAALRRPGVPGRRQGRPAAQQLR
jgi:hypothetical protein